MRLKTVMYPNEALTNPKFDDIENWEDVRKSITKLKKTMRSNKQPSYAMAANQAKVRHKLFVMKKDGRSDLVFVHPEIIKFSGKVVSFKERCLSFSKNISYDIMRPESISIRCMDENGIGVVDSFSGLEARIIQHEVDHLNGITMFDRWREM